ncbi:proteasome subunit beta [Nocardia sp. NBC_00508]|uniref:proteasome subunit beta n=1 Tax=Nocardia sp. NBC_00508 TaxID=2975992 RepID=UPI002E811542|nr:proteasome subunit beta [Nocardia sp. NBC_00508]WUD65763.1 proteasome subunit beta [Nocardia sp. NBC_00508]
MTFDSHLPLGLRYPAASFSEYLRRYAPQLLPDPGIGGGGAGIAPHGTTIVAVSYRGGVLLAGDRRGTMAHMVATRDMQKVVITDTYSAAGFAGTVGMALEMIRLFAVELEHYEKIEGASLTFDGKATKLSAMVRANLAAALQDMAVIPLLVGYDLDAADPERAGRIVSFDAVGGRYEERFGYTAAGSGSVFAKSSLKKTYRRDIEEQEALRLAMEALVDAADDDTATGGPDLLRDIYPTAVVVGAEGAVEVPLERLAELARTVVDARAAAERH